MIRFIITTCKAWMCGSRKLRIRIYTSLPQILEMWAQQLLHSLDHPPPCSKPPMARAKGSPRSSAARNRALGPRPTLDAARPRRPPAGGVGAVAAWAMTQTARAWRRGCCGTGTPGWNLRWWRRGLRGTTPRSGGR